MNKKKVLAIALVVCLLAILSFGTLAWFTDDDQVTNTFTVGSIKIEQHEQQPVMDDEGRPTNELEDFEQDKVLLPVVDTEDPASDPNYEYKMVSVENVGKNDAYVRTSLAVPTALVGYLELDVNIGKWQFQSSRTETIDGVSYTVYSYYYVDAIAATEETELLLKGVYLNAVVDIRENPESGVREFCKPNAAGGYDFSGFAVEDAQGNACKVDVVVYTQAVQAEGFADALTALTSAFGA